MRTTIFLMTVFLIPSQMYSQNQNSPDKIQTIKANPEAYVKQGGVLDDRLITLPEKTTNQIVTPDFIIHTNDKSSSSDETDTFLYPHKDFQDGNSSPDQTSDEYLEKKDLWISENKVLYDIKTKSTDDRELRNKVLNKK